MTGGKFVVEYCSECEHENEFRWNVEEFGYKAYCPHCGAEIKELKDILEKVPTNAYDLQVEASEKLENQIKPETIKDFSKRLKSKLNDLEFRTKTNRKTVPTKFCDDNANWVMHECIPEEIDKLIKEMTEEEK